MRGFEFFQGAILLGLGLTIAGCAGRTPAPEDPSSASDATEPKSDAETASAESASHSQTLDVGMEYKDKGDENRRATHDAPPTATWKPVEKEKAADPKKATVTAAR
jgi:hypothetical protein